MTAWLTLERDRIHEHLRGAEQLARSHAPPLDRTRALVRRLLLDELAEYRVRGEYPHNRDVEGAVHPTFVDAAGVRCAMAHLMEFGGAQELVERVARTQNLAYLEELAQIPELAAWLAAAGLTVEEAARIQPGYSYIAAECVCGGGFGDMVVRGGGAPSVVNELTSVLEVEFVRAFSEGEPALATAWVARVIAVHGSADATVGDEIVVDVTEMAEAPTSAQAALIDVAEGQVLVAPEAWSAGAAAPNVVVPFGAGGKTVFCIAAEGAGIVVPSATTAEQATARGTGDTSSCTQHLIRLDSRWAEGKSMGIGGETSSSSGNPGGASSGGASSGGASSGGASSSGAEGAEGSSGGGCDVVHGPSSSLGILLAIVGVLVARRRARSL